MTQPDPMAMLPTFLVFLAVLGVVGIGAIIVLSIINSAHPTATPAPVNCSACGKPWPKFPPLVVAGTVRCGFCQQSREG